MRRRILVAVLVVAAALVASQPAVAATGTGRTFSATEGASFSGVVAHFTSLVDAATATINWGDGAVTPNATVTPNGGPNEIDVSGTHTYAEEGTFGVFVSIQDDGNGGSATSAARVADAPLTIAGLPLNTVRGTPFSNQRVATFTDADPGATLSDYTATINWGDGANTAGAVVPNGGGGFAVNGSHGYGAAGSYPVVVTVFDAGGATATAQITAGVSALSGELAFTSTRSGRSEIWVMHADGSGQTQLTFNSAGQFYAPAWSPDGTRLAAGALVFGRQSPLLKAAAFLPTDLLLTVREPGVWVLNADGSGQSRLAVVQKPAQAAPSWSRDGRRIAYVDLGPAPDIFGVPTTGVQFPVALTNSKSNITPDWSPKGDTIAFASRRSGPVNQIWTMDPDGNHEAPLFSDGRSNTSPAYSPDSARIAYVGAFPNDFFHIFVANANGSGQRMLTPTVGVDPTWAPDATKIAFTALDASGNGQIHVINADGTGEHAITTTGDNTQPTWRRTACSQIRFCVRTEVICALCPALELYRIRIPVFRVGPRPTTLIARTIPRGTAFTYKLSTKARVQITISRVRNGHRVGRHCSLRGAPRGALPCLVASKVGTLRRRGHKGVNTTTFSGRLGRRALGLGHYQAAIVAIDARGRRSVPRLLDFDVV